MRVHRAQRRRQQVRRRRLALGCGVAVALAAAGLVVAQLAAGGSRSAAGSHRTTSHSTGPTTATPGGSSTDPGGSEPPKTGSVTISAVGDTMLGYAGVLAPNPGSYFDGVRSQITGDIRFANLEGALTDLTSGKCAVLHTSCYEFRAPPSCTAALPEKVLLITVSVPPKLSMAPPPVGMPIPPFALLPEKALLVTVRVLPLSLKIAPP